MKKFNRDQLLPYESRFLDVDGAKLHYLDEGEGHPVVLLHGNPTWCFYFRHLIRDLKDQFRVIAIDYIGCGLSDRPKDRHYRAVDRADQVEAVIEHLQLTDFSLVMHDWGGPIGTLVALRNLSRVRRLVYLNTTLTETESLPLSIKLAASPLVGKFLTQYTKRFLKLTTSYGVCRKLTPEVRRAYYYPYRTKARRSAIWDFVSDIPFQSSHPTYVDMLSLAERLDDLRSVPVQIIWGLKDPCFHREMLSKITRQLPHADVLELPDASHLVLEDAEEVANPVIRGFLSGSSSRQISADKEALERSSRNPLYAALMEQLRERPKNDAVIVPAFLGDPPRFSHANYKSLSSLVNRYRRGLEKLGLEPGDKVVMLVTPGVDFVALSYAVMGSGAVPVFIDPGIGKDGLLRCIEDIEPAVFIGSPKAHVLRLLKRSAFQGLKFHLMATAWSLPGTLNLSLLQRFSSMPLPVENNPDEIGLIAYTSGATGHPKGVIFTNNMLQAQLEIFSSEFGLEPGRKDLPLLPIFSLYSIALGVCSVFPPVNPTRPLSLDPRRIEWIIQDLSIDYSFGSPTLWNKIAEYCIRSRVTLPSVRKVFMAGAPVSNETLAQVEKILEGGEVYTPYGATEALPVTLVSSQQLGPEAEVPASGGEQGTPVGEPVSLLDLKIVARQEGVVEDIADFRELPAFEVGEVIVSGPNVSANYLKRPEADEIAKVRDGEDFWHRMGDMGYLDPEGRLYFCGRKAHLVETPERTYYSVPCERIFNRHPKVYRSALISLEGRPAAGIVVEPYPKFWPDDEKSQERFLVELRNLAKESEITNQLDEFFFCESFPVDARHNAKIFRDKLSAWVAELKRTERYVARAI